MIRFRTTFRTFAMDRFPAELADVLTPYGRAILDGAVPPCPKFTPKDVRRDDGVATFAEEFGHAPCVALLDVIEPAAAHGMYEILCESFLDLVRPYHVPLPPNAALGRYDKAGGGFPDTHRFSVAHLQEPGPARSRAEEIGLIRFQSSDSFLHFTRNVTGYELAKADNGFQINLYRHGDYVGPHADWYGSDDFRHTHYYIDVQISLSGPEVDRMFLVYQNGRFLSGVRSITSMGGLAIARLPFWHFTTPLEAKPGMEHLAKRWLLMSSYRIAGLELAEQRPYAVCEA